MSNRSARLRQPGTVGGSSGPRISRPACADPRRFRSATQEDRNGWRSASAAARVRRRAGFSHDSLSCVNVPRRCCRPGCPHYAVATLTFVYLDSTAVVGPLATVPEPHSWDLCVATRPDHRAARLGAGSSRRPAAVAPGRGRPGRAGRRGARGPRRRTLDQRFRVSLFRLGPGCARRCLMAPPARRPESHGRRRGHLRVLPDPSE